jgi:hypothetical protein
LKSFDGVIASQTATLLKMQTAPETAATESPQAVQLADCVIPSFVPAVYDHFQLLRQMHLKQPPGAVTAKRIPVADA